MLNNNSDLHHLMNGPERNKQVHSNDPYSTLNQSNQTENKSNLRLLKQQHQLELITHSSKDILLPKLTKQTLVQNEEGNPFQMSVVD